MAAQYSYLAHGDLLARLTDVPGLSGDESRALARIGLASYFAGAVLLPYRAFLSAAEGVGYDIGLLGERFGVSVETVCHRLSTLQRPGEAGVPFVFVRVDRAGNISKRHSATDFHFSRIGGTCPLWNVYEAFSSPDRFITQVAQMPDGRTYLWVASHHRRAAPGATVRRLPSSPSGWAATCVTRRAWSTRAAWTSATRRRRCRSAPGAGSASGSDARSAPSPSWGGRSTSTSTAAATSPTRPVSLRQAGGQRSSGEDGGIACSRRRRRPGSPAS